MTSTFDVLAEPTRRRILDLLRDDERPVNELVSTLKVSQPGVAPPVAFERLVRAVIAVSVDLDDEPLLRPDRIDLEPGHADVGPR